MENYRSKLRPRTGPRARPELKPSSIPRLQVQQARTVQMQSSHKPIPELKQCDQVPATPAATSKRVLPTMPVKAKSSNCHKEKAKAIVSTPSRCNQLKQQKLSRSINQSFTALLEWKKRRTHVPLTSTPTPNPPQVSKKDLQTCFGLLSLDDSSSIDDGNGHKAKDESNNCISPI